LPKSVAAPDISNFVYKFIRSEVARSKQQGNHHADIFVEMNLPEEFAHREALFEIAALNKCSSTLFFPKYCRISAVAYP
jgi:hypothetical protein